MNPAYPTLFRQKHYSCLIERFECYNIHDADGMLEEIKNDYMEDFYTRTLNILKEHDNKHGISEY